MVDGPRNRGALSFCTLYSIYMIDFNTPNARRMEILGVVILAGLVLAFTIWYMATHKAPEPYIGIPEVATTTPEVLAPKVIEEHGQYYDIEVTYPAETPLKAALSVEADAEAVSVMEDFVEESVREFKAQGNFENLTAEDIQIMGLSEDRKESITITYEEKSGDHTISYAYTLYVDTLGAHPNTFYRTFTFDLTTGAELEIADLFVPRAAYLTRLSAISRFELAKSLGEFANIEYIAQGTTPEALNFQNYAIDGDELVLLFPPYQVAPYAAGSQEVSIPLKQLEEILKPTYVSR